MEAGIMSLIQAIMMGILQGLTEFLPVSSSGHLAIFKNIFKVNTDTGLLFDTLLHLGTLIAVCIVYRKDVIKLIVAFFQLVGDLFMNLKAWISNRFRGGDEPYRKLISSAYRKFVVLIIVSSVPTAIIGLLLNSFIERAGRSLLVPGICLVITAIILLVSDMSGDGRKKVKKATYGEAAIIGVAQGIATLPGISRSGTTITACLLLGFDRAFAVRYSFLMSLPAILGANLLELRHLDGEALAGGSLVYYLIGAIVAGVVGYICIKVMIRLVQNRKFQYFAYYCAVIGVICILYYFVKG